MDYGGFKGLNKLMNYLWADKLLANIAENPKCDGYQSGLASMVYKFVDKKTFGGAIINEIMFNKELAYKY